MGVEPDIARKVRQSRRSAQASCLVFGLGLVVWGLAPALVQRFSTGTTPTLDSLAAGSLSMLVGLGFIALAVLISRQLHWALWAALLASAALLVGGLAVTAILRSGGLAMFPVLFAGCTGLTSWLAIETRRAAELVYRAERRKTDPS